MNLQQFSRRILRFPFWENREKCWPLIPGPYPKLGPLQSRQGVLQITGFPTGAAINGVAAAPNRGVIGLRLNWLDGPPDWNDAINIAVYMGGDPIEPEFVANPANAALGNCSIQAALADTAGDVAVKVANAIDFVFTAGGGIKWQSENGRIAFNNPQTTLNLISPKTAKTAELPIFSGSMNTLATERVLASVVPFVYAGCRPGPQVVHGARFDGFAPSHIE